MKTQQELLKRDATRDIGAELLESVRQMKAGQGVAVCSPVMTGEELGYKLLESVRQMKAGQGVVVYPPATASREDDSLLPSREK